MRLTDRIREKWMCRKSIEGAEKAPEQKEPVLKEKPVLEKGDLPAILIAAFFNFILPIMLLCALICYLTYLFFTRAR